MFREEFILKAIRGKEVLDVGSVGQTSSYNLWEQMKKAAKSLTGIDIVPSRAPATVCGNMESYSFGRFFDVVVAGDVIEHVDNPGLFLQNVHRHLKDGGALILTTPNAKWPTVFLKPNPTHTLWHDRYTLSHLLARHGFEVAYFAYYFGNKNHYNFFLWPLVLRQAMLVVAKKRVTAKD
jgi:2-polyprenyl-3-methyl-5-hydroxy-6-metoxy-1,4-benzoquinol methylase